jgi:hypothetical protein
MPKPGRRECPNQRRCCDSNLKSQTVIARALSNPAIPLIALGKGAWAARLPLVRPPAADYRDGLYDPAAAS